MDNKNPYQEMTENLNEINRQQAAGQQPPPYGVGYAAASAPMPGVTISTSTASDNAMPPGMPILPQPVGPHPAEMACPHCRCRIRTRTDHRSTAKTHIACLLLSWTLCCCCLPYCMDSCRNTNHFCPMCGAFLGTYAS